jgi:hypothetical protein
MSVDEELEILADVVSAFRRTLRCTTRMKHALVVIAVCGSVSAAVSAHGSGDAITWNREISRLVLDKCSRSHRNSNRRLRLPASPLFASAEPLRSSERSSSTGCSPSR